MVVCMLVTYVATSCKIPFKDGLKFGDILIIFYGESTNQKGSSSKFVSISIDWDKKQQVNYLFKFLFNGLRSKTITYGDIVS